MSEIKRQVLGRGLSSLLGETTANEGTDGEMSDIFLSIEAVVPGRKQPRFHFPEEELESLSLSIREKGVLQPILVRKHPSEPEKYEIIAGERRWRAAKRAGFLKIPALIRNFTDGETLEVGLLENIQRQDLSPIEEAEGYRRLAEEFDHTQETLSRVLGKSRSHIANTLRLLTLPKKVIECLSDGRLSAGHGRALVNTDNPEELADLILAKGLSVRQVEQLRKEKTSDETPQKKPKNFSPSSFDSNLEDAHLSDQLSSLLDTKVNVILAETGGKIIVSFSSPEALDELLVKFNSITR